MKAFKFFSGFDFRERKMTSKKVHVATNENQKQKLEASMLNKLNKNLNTILYSFSICPLSPKIA